MLPARIGKGFPARGCVNEADVLTFVRDAIRSAWVLDLLVLLEQNGARTWKTTELVTELRANARVIIEGLATLRAAGLVEMDAAGYYRYGPASDALAETGRLVVDLYTRKPMAVIKAVLSAPSDKIQTFADAFRFRR